MEQWTAPEPDFTSTESKNLLCKPGLNTRMQEITWECLWAWTECIFSANRTLHLTPTHVELVGRVSSKEAGVRPYHIPISVHDAGLQMKCLLHPACWTETRPTKLNFFPQPLHGPWRDSSDLFQLWRFQVWHTTRWITRISLCWNVNMGKMWNSQEAQC